MLIVKGPLSDDSRLPRRVRPWDQVPAKEPTLGKVALARIRLAQDGVVDLRLVNLSFKRPELVIIDIGSHDQARICVIDIPRSRPRGALELTVHVDLELRPIVGTDNVIPASQLKAVGGFQVGEGIGGGQGDAEGRAVVAQQPAPLKAAVILDIAADAAPPRGRIQSDPGLDGKLPDGKIRGIGRFDDHPIVVSIEHQRRGGGLDARAPEDPPIKAAGRCPHRIADETVRSEDPAIPRFHNSRPQNAGDQ